MISYIYIYSLLSQIMRKNRIILLLNVFAEIESDSVIILCVSLLSKDNERATSYKLINIIINFLVHKCNLILVNEISI